MKQKEREARTELMCPKAWCCLGEVPYVFSRSSAKFQSHTAKTFVDFDPNLAILDFQFEFTNGFETMQKAWSSLEDVRWCFSRSFVKFQGHAG